MPQHRHLLSIRDRVLEGQRSLQQLVASAAAHKSARGAAAPTGEGAPPHIEGRASRASAEGFGFGDPFREPVFETEPSAEAGMDGGALDEERAQLMRQDALLQRLVQSLKQAKLQGEQALALAQCSVGQT